MSFWKNLVSGREGTKNIIRNKVVVSSPEIRDPYISHLARGVQQRLLELDGGKWKFATFTNLLFPIISDRQSTYWDHSVPIESDYFLNFLYRKIKGYRELDSLVEDKNPKGETVVSKEEKIRKNFLEALQRHTVSIDDRETNAYTVWQQKSINNDPNDSEYSLYMKPFRELPQDD